MRGAWAKERSDLATTRADIDKLGDKPTSSSLNTWLINIGKKTDKLGDAAQDAYYWYRLLSNASKPGDPKTPPPGALIPRASGGPVVPGGVYRVGEYEEERLVMFPGGGGWVEAGGGRRSAGQGGGGGGAPVVIQLTLDGRKVAQVVDEHLYYKLQRAVPSLYRT